MVGRPAARAIQAEGAPIERSARRSRGGRRGRRAQEIGRINARARERQVAWAETGQPDLTDALTHKLDRDFAELRRADRDDYATGTPEGEPFAGKTQEFR